MPEDRCKYCGARYADCRRPVSHQLPTVSTIHGVPAIRASVTRHDDLTASELQMLNGWRP